MRALATFVIPRLFRRENKNLVAKIGIKINNYFQLKCRHMRLENRSDYKNATSTIFEATRLSLKLNETYVLTLFNPLLPA